jgi:cytochrome c biogenesis factor
MDCTKFTPDYFNNVAAIAVVLLFTKVVMHRWRRGSRAHLFLALFHVAAVLAAGAAIVISLWATGTCEDVSHPLAWVFLAFAGLGLLVDILIEEVADFGAQPGGH